MEAGKYLLGQRDFRALHAAGDIVHWQAVFEPKGPRPVGTPPTQGGKLCSEFRYGSRFKVSSLLVNINLPP